MLRSSGPSSHSVDHHQCRRRGRPAPAARSSSDPCPACGDAAQSRRGPPAAARPVKSCSTNAGDDERDLVVPLGIRSSRPVANVGFSHLLAVAVAPARSPARADRHRRREILPSRPSPAPAASRSGPSSCRSRRIAGSKRLCVIWSSSGEWGHRKEFLAPRPAVAVAAGGRARADGSRAKRAAASDHHHVDDSFHRVADSPLRVQAKVRSPGLLRREQPGQVCGTSPPAGADPPCGRRRWPSGYSTSTSGSRLPSSNRTLTALAIERLSGSW